MNLDDLTVPPTENIMIYGEPKSGKTELIGELTNHGYRLHIIDIEESYKTLLKLPSANKQNIEIYPLPDYPNNPLGARFMFNLVKNSGRSYVCKEHMVVNCPGCKDKPKHINLDLRDLDPTKDILVVESANQLQMSVMSDILGVNRLRDKPEWDDFSRQGRTMEMILGFLQHAPISTIMTSHLLESEDATGAKGLYPIIGTRAYSINAGKFFDHIVYTKKEGIGNYRAFSSSKIANIQAASRYGIDISTSSPISLAPIFDYSKEQAANGKQVLSFGDQRAAETLSNVASQSAGSAGKPLSASAIIAAAKAGTK